MQADNLAQLVERLVIGGNDAVELLGSEVDRNGIADHDIEFIRKRFSDRNLISVLRT